MAKPGNHNRRSGHDFERWVVRQLKGALDDLVNPELIRRGRQGEGAAESDVAGVPGVWLECQKAANPTPRKKLEQAEGDVARLLESGALTHRPVEVAVCRRNGSRAVSVSVRFDTLRALRGSGSVTRAAVDPLMVTLEWPDFVRLLRAHLGSKHEE